MICSFGVSGTALKWFSSYLQSRSQRIFINGTAPEQFKHDQGVPQGSCLGPVEFTEYSSPVFSVIDQGVPQGSCLGPVEFTEYTSPVFSVIDQGVPQGSCLGPVEFTEYSSPVFSVIDQGVP